MWLHVGLAWHLSWPLLHLSCTSPDLSCTPPAPLLTPAAPLFPAPLQQKLDTSNHFKTNAKLCKAFMCFYVKLSDVITCWACMAPLLTSPAPLLHLSWPLLHPSCTSPDPCCASLPCTSPAEVRRLSERHFKPFQNKCEAMQSFFVLLYRAIRCDYVLGLHGTSPDLSCTSPDLMHPSCTSPDPCCTFLCCTSPAEVRRRSFWHQIILWEDYGILRNSEFIIVHPFGVYAGSLQLS